MVFEPLDWHECPIGMRRVSRVRLSPPLWVLTLCASFGNFIDVVAYCPYCGARLEPPAPAPATCTCSHLDRQHEWSDPLLDKRGACHECACTEFAERG